MKFRLICLSIIFVLVMAVVVWKEFFLHFYELVSEFSVLESLLMLIGWWLAWTIVNNNFSTIKERGENYFFSILINLLSLFVVLSGLVVLVHSLNLSIFFDEQFQLGAIRGILRTGLPSFPTGFLYVRDLGYSYPTAVIAWLSGGEVTEVTGRILSLVYYLLTALLIWFSGKKIFDAKVALFALLIFCWSIPMIFFGNFARGYMGLTFFTLLGAVSFYNIYFLNENKWLKWFFFSALIAPLYHKPGIWLMLLLPLLFMKRFDRRYRLIILVNVCVIILLFAGIVVMTLSGKGSWYNFLTLLPQRLSWPSPFFLLYYWLAFPSIFFTVGLGLLYNLKAKRNELKDYYFFILTFGLIFLVSIYNFFWRPGYVQWIFPLMALTFGYSLEKWLNIFVKVLNLNYQKVFLVLIILLLVYQINNLLFFWQLIPGDLLPRFKFNNATVYKYPDYRSQSEYLKQNYQTGDVVISVSSVPQVYEFYAPGLVDYHYYWKSDEILAETPLVKNYGDFISLLETYKAEHRRVWLLTDYMTDFECEVCIVDIKNSSDFYIPIWQYMEENSMHSVYIGSDNISKIYLFD